MEGGEETWPRGSVPPPPPAPRPNGYEVGYGAFSINGRALGHGEPVRVWRGSASCLVVLNASATENIQLVLSLQTSVSPLMILATVHISCASAVTGTAGEAAAQQDPDGILHPTIIVPVDVLGLDLGLSKRVCHRRLTAISGRPTPKPPTCPLHAGIGYSSCVR